MNLNLNTPDFDNYSSDQQFLNVVGALERIETQQGGLTAEEVWEMALQVVAMLKKSNRPDIKAKRLLTLISSQIEEKKKDRTREQIIHSTHCVLFCVNYLLCANEEEPDPNNDVIDNISEELSRMPDIAELFYAVEQEEDKEEAKGNKVKARNVLGKEPLQTQGQMHQLMGNDEWIVSKLTQLVCIGCWQKGLTEQTVLSGLFKALALEEPGLNTKEMELSNKLWAMLRERRGQNEEGSLKITWLNIVGYCIRHGMLKGPATKLCKEFYPKAGVDDYKAINKGKKANESGDLKSFAEIEPLLDRYLKPKN